MDNELKKECYAEFRESLLNRLYEGLDNYDISGKIMRCCEQLGKEAPRFSSFEDMVEFHSSIELEYIEKRIFVSGLH